MHESHPGSQPRPSAGRTGRRAPRAWQDPALWAWIAVAVFALLPLTHAMAAPVRPVPVREPPAADRLRAPATARRLSWP